MIEKFNLENISLAVGVLVILIGLWGLLTQKNLIKIVIGFALFDTGIHIVMVSVGYIKGRWRLFTPGSVDQGDKTRDSLQCR